MSGGGPSAMEGCRAAAQLRMTGMPLLHPQVFIAGEVAASLFGQSPTAFLQVCAPCAHPQAEQCKHAVLSFKNAA